MWRIRLVIVYILGGSRLRTPIKGAICIRGYGNYLRTYVHLCVHIYIYIYIYIYAHMHIHPYRCVVCPLSWLKMIDYLGFGLILQSFWGAVENEGFLVSVQKP